MRVRPRSSAKNARLLSPLSIVLLFSKPEMPRKLIKPKLPSGTAPGVNKAKLDQRRPLIGSSLIEVWLILVENLCCEVLMTGASALTSTVPVTGPTLSATFEARLAPDFNHDVFTRHRTEAGRVYRDSIVSGCRFNESVVVSSVVAVSSLFVPSFRTVTAAPGNHFVGVG